MAGNNAKMVLNIGDIIDEEGPLIDFADVGNNNKGSQGDYDGDYNSNEINHHVLSNMDDHQEEIIIHSTSKLDFVDNEYIQDIFLDIATSVNELPTGIIN